jgi:uncharacterized protein YbjT (DUF2867 family)
MRVAITTPTGHIGRRVVEILQDRGEHELILLARNPDKLAEEAARGATVVQGDLTDAAYVRRATTGASSLLVVIPLDPRTDDARAYQHTIAHNVENAVRTNHIERVVLVSSIGGHIGTGTGPVDGLHDAEQTLRKVAPTLTILRPAYFMENFEMALPTITRDQTIYMPVSGKTSLPMIATRDIAAAAADALTDTDWHGVRVKPLHGSRDYSFSEAADIIGDAIGHPVKFVTIPVEQARQHMLGMGASEDVTHNMLELYDAIETGRITAEHPRGPETTTPTTFEAFARDTLAPALKAMEQHV